MDFKEYNEFLTKRPIEVFFERMEERGIDIFKVDEVVITYDNGFWENVKIKAYKDKDVVYEVCTDSEKEWELIKTLQCFRNRLENDLGTKITQHVKREKDAAFTKDKGIIFTKDIVIWTIDCTNIK